MSHNCRRMPFDELIRDDDIFLVLSAPAPAEW